jgi:hypothetical protein
MLRAACIVLAILLSSFTGANYQLVKSNQVNAQMMTTDKLGNCYTVLENNEVDKYNNIGVKEFNFSNKNLGKLKWVDATNPLKLLLFYPDFNQVVMLDNKLSLRTQFSLRELDILQPLLICTSVNDGIWIYDQEDFQLKRLDTDLKIMQESGNIVQVTGVTLQPVQLVEANGYLYLNNPKTGVLVFDLFGTYYKTIPIKNIAAFQIVGDELFYFKEKKGYTFHLKTLADTPYEMPDIADTTVQSIRIENQKLFLLKPGALNIYSKI